jgi:hypothetical protein
MISDKRHPWQMPFYFFGQAYAHQNLSNAGFRSDEIEPKKSIRFRMGRHKDVKTFITQRFVFF